MKPFATVVAALVIAAPLFAEDAKKPAEQPKTQTAAAKAPAPAAPLADSPLVAAAKAGSKKSGKKVIVITNDNLTKEGTGNAHITTTKESREIIVPPEDPALVEARKTEARNKALKDREDRLAAQKAKADAAAEQKVRNVAGKQDLDGPYGDDPAATEHVLEELAKQREAQKQQQQEKPQPPM